MFSAAGVWPLLALLAAAATGSARDELATAIGQDAEHGHDEAVALIEALRSGTATSAALGVWTQAGVRLDPDWIRSLPPGTVGTITDQAALDDWCNRATDGQIKEFPLSLSPEALVILASALAIKSRWQQAFQDGVHRATSGPWADRSFPALHRSSADLTAVVMSEGEQPLTRAVVAGEDDVDVHLLIGDDRMTAAEVLRRGLDPGESVRDGTTLRPGDTLPGVTVEQTTWATEDRLVLIVPGFEITTSHDLLEDADLFGLATAQDDTRGHFPAISNQPLAIGEAVQQVRAAFTAEHFEAAAVTAFALRAGGAAARSETPVLSVQVAFDRPFGFIAFHRPTGLALVAGWVAQPPILDAEDAQVSV